MDAPMLREFASIIAAAEELAVMDRQKGEIEDARQISDDVYQGLAERGTIAPLSAPGIWWA